jgi:hypothetical protein
MKTLPTYPVQEIDGSDVPVYLLPPTRVPVGVDPIDLLEERAMSSTSITTHDVVDIIINPPRSYGDPKLTGYTVKVVIVDGSGDQLEITCHTVDGLAVTDLDGLCQIKGNPEANLVPRGGITLEDRGEK